MTSSGIIGYGTYLPHARLKHSAIAQVLGPAPGAGTRAVASYDEDTTTMGVESARPVMRSPGTDVRRLFFSTAYPVYQDKSNASAIHAALHMDASIPAFDFTGSVRSGVGALEAALSTPDNTLVVLSDIRMGLAGSDDERSGGDGAVSLLVGPGTDHTPLLADYLGGASITQEFLDRWRAPGEPTSQVWEQRFGARTYSGLAERAFDQALKTAELTPADVNRLAVAGTQTRATTSALAAKVGPDTLLADDLATLVGNTGTAHPGLLLASVLDEAAAGEVIALVVLADGVDVLLFRTTDALGSHRRDQSVISQARGGAEISYAKFLTWRGQLHREPPRRPQPDRPAAPASLRSESWKYAFVGTSCTACGSRHLPPQRVCQTCGATDQMVPEPLADIGATIATYTVDHLALSVNPPVVVVVIDLEGGGRFQCEMTDVDPDTVDIGDPVEMTFRRLFTANGVHNYFWKARPSGERRS